jgi:hypothetical protein
MAAKIPIQNIKCVESYRANGRMDGQIDTLVIPIKGFHPLINIAVILKSMQFKNMTSLCKKMSL